jgi:hypothetical protein
MDIERLCGWGDAAQFLWGIDGRPAPVSMDSLPMTLFVFSLMLSDDNTQNFLNDSLHCSTG